jgi:hypothetical protein
MTNCCFMSNIMNAIDRHDWGNSRDSSESQHETSHLTCMGTYCMKWLQSYFQNLLCTRFHSVDDSIYIICFKYINCNQWEHFTGYIFVWQNHAQVKYFIAGSEMFYLQLSHDLFKYIPFASLVTALNINRVINYAWLGRGDQCTQSLL